MQLTVITDEISQDFEHALDVMLEYGIKGAELRGLWGTNIAELTDEQAARAKACLAARGMHVVCLATPFFKCDLEQSPAASESTGNAAGPLHLATAHPFAKQMDILRRCIALAHTFDTKMLRVFSFWRKAALTHEIEAQILGAFDEPLRLAKQSGITLALENEHACFLGSGAETAHFMRQITSPNLKVVWDPGNAFSMGEQAFPDGYEAVKPWIAHVHVKDARMIETPDHGLQTQFCVIGEGQIDYAAQFAALKADGYRGCISLETHFVPPTGSGADGKGTPEDGSRPCLAALRTLLPADTV